jgi:hypothetical protein
MHCRLTNTHFLHAGSIPAVSTKIIKPPFGAVLLFLWAAGIEPERGREKWRFPVEENNEYPSVRNRGFLKSPTHGGRVR